MIVDWFKFKMQSVTTSSPNPPHFCRSTKIRAFKFAHCRSEESQNSPSELIMDDRHPHEPFELMLCESIQRFHSDRRSGVPNFDAFSSIFSRIIQTTSDPPLEVLWFYSAVSFRSENLEVLKRVSLVKELLGFMVSCCRCGNGLKKVAALAPVVYELHRLVGDVMFWFKEARDEVRCLIEKVVSYVSICCFENEPGFSGMPEFSSLLMDVVSVWLADKAEVNRDNLGNLRLFFPMVSDQVSATISIGRDIHFLAGSVMCEVFLLILSLKCCSEAPRWDLRKDLHQQAVQVIAGFRDLSFFGENLLREVLYDVAMTLQYPFHVPVNGYQLPGPSMKAALRWLLVAEKADQFLRASGDDTKALSYVTAFVESPVPVQLIEWVICKTGASRPVLSTPAALIGWFLAIEERGLQIFNDHVLLAHLRSLASDAEINDVKTAQGHSSFDQEMTDCSVAATVLIGQRKRKEERQDNAYLQAKFIKVHCHGNYVKEKFLAQW